MNAKKLVVIEVIGGVADVYESPDDVEVKIVDWDNHPTCESCQVRPADDVDCDGEPICQECIKWGSDTQEEQRMCCTSAHGDVDGD